MIEVVTLMYLTYTEYKNMGGTLDGTAFSEYLVDAEILIDWYTFNRLHTETEIPLRVKQCVFKLVTLADMKSKTLVLGREVNGSGDAAVASQSNDGVSISYNTISASRAFDLIKSECNQVIQQYLNGTTDSKGRKLLYRGLYPNE